MKRITCLLDKIAASYDECLETISFFEHYQPLVRRPDLIFDFLSSDFDEEGYQYADFLRHIGSLRDYQRRLNDLEDGYAYRLFRVNVASVKAYLNEKIN
jgi:hypothetical protein